ncbi:MHFG family PEP-CTERM protein [Massilia sp. BJB1822]|uniref:MHFG family PEP-CTERM protein n=1 Tax=Massilia sp. BJB1822 TaxID=2744470 RepID=UPI001C3C4FEC|nr:MHFG family PEP-CTERM protein [Massilia sp. BJB1822]
MSIALATTLVAATLMPRCSWDRPGRNPYRGTPAAAMSRYPDIPEPQRRILAERIARGQMDEMVDISRDAIQGKGKHAYESEIRDMHFAARTVCGEVTRSKWAPERLEPAAIYCEGEHCIIVPKICNNISRITRKPLAAAPLAQKKKLPKLVTPGDPGLDEDVRDDAREIEADVTDALAALLDEAPVNGGNFQPGHHAEPGDLIGFIEGDDDPKRDIFSRNSHGNPITPIDPVSPVPEPSTWLMLLGGLGLLGAWRLRRKG